MQIRDTRLAVLIAATGLWACFAGPVKAECEAAGCSTKSVAGVKTSAPIQLSKFNKQKTRASAKSNSKSAHLKRGAKIADAASRGKSSKSETGDNKSGLPVLPASVANARAELTTGDPRSASDEQARNIAAADDTDIVTMDGVQIASADQLNDIDRALVNAQPEVRTDEQVTSSAPAAPTGRIVRAVPPGDRPVFMNSDAADPWSKTSLIGKIFIAFGSLLTLASAARLMIA